MMAPSPEIEVKNSAMTMATTARPTERRRPAMPGVDADREHRHQEDDRDLDCKAEPEPQDQQRHEGHERHRIAGGDIDSDPRFERPRAPDHKTKRHADHDRKRVADRKGPQALTQRGRKLARSRER